MVKKSMAQVAVDFFLCLQIGTFDAVCSYANGYPEIYEADYCFWGGKVFHCTH